MNITLQSVRNSLVSNSRSIHVNTAELFILASGVFAAPEFLATTGDEGSDEWEYKPFYGAFAITGDVTDWVIKQGTVKDVEHITKSHTKQAKMIMKQGTGDFAAGTFKPKYYNVITTPTRDAIEWKKNPDGEYKLLADLKKGAVTFSEVNGDEQKKQRKADKAKATRILNKVKKERSNSVELTAYDSKGDAVKVIKTQALVALARKNPDGENDSTIRNAMAKRLKVIEKAIREYNLVATKSDNHDALKLSS